MVRNSDGRCRTWWTRTWLSLHCPTGIYVFTPRGPAGGWQHPPVVGSQLLLLLVLTCVVCSGALNWSNRLIYIYIIFLFFFYDASMRNWIIITCAATWHPSRPAWKRAKCRRSCAAITLSMGSLPAQTRGYLIRLLAMHGVREGQLMLCLERAPDGVSDVPTSVLLSLGVALF